jgi:haloalkane dehalogenase
MEALFVPHADAFLRYHHLPGIEPTYVYLAGLGSGATAGFARVISGSPLAAHRAILPDWLGCGYSDRPEQFSYTVTDHADTIAYLLDTLQRKGCVLVGHSFGGSVAITLAANRPDLVSQLFLAEANLDAGGGLVSQGVAAMSEDEFVNHGYHDMVSQFRAMSSDNLGIAVLTGNWQIAAPKAIYRGAVNLVQGSQPSWRSMLYKLAIPRTYIFGEQSLPDNDSEILPAYGIRIATVRNAGHGMIIDNPEGFAAVITD